MARDLFHQSQGVAEQNQSNREITFDTQLKTALLGRNPSFLAVVKQAIQNDDLITALYKLI